MYKSIILLFLLFGLTGAKAQTKRPFTWYDKYTYEFYERKQWDRLIEACKMTIGDGYDYFYLRMRIGIAYYEKGEYRLAIKHFEKALGFNSGDPIAAEYLYYSYKYSARIMDANLTYAKYKKQLSARGIESTSGFITGFYSEAGLKLISPSTDEFGALKYIHFGAYQQLGSRLNLYHGYMRVSQNMYDQDAVIGPGRPGSYQSKLKYVQNEYYLKGTLALTKGLQIISSLHTQSITDTTQYNNLSYWLALNSTFKLFDLNLAYGQSNIKDTLQQQFTVGLTYYPAKNQNFYSQSVLTYHIDGTENNTIFYQKLGLRTGDNTWFELYGSFGDMKNVQELDGFYIYNTTDHLNKRIGFSGIFMLSEKVKLFAGYTTETYEQIGTELAYKQHYLYTGLQFLLKK